MNLQYLTIDELSVLDKPNTFVIIPLGSCEQHGPHLPLGTKSFLSETIAFQGKINKKWVSYRENYLKSLEICEGATTFVETNPE